MPFRPGEHLGDYKVLRLLGAGGMGEVYQVRNTLSDRIEAMKVLPGALQANKDLQERFLREIKISAALRHPHIAELHTAQRVDGLLVMVMEFVDGVTLDYLTRNGPLPLKNALHYTVQVLDALAFAHQRGVVHRDIKPQNVMVTEGDSVRLMDFGIARSLGDQSLTMTGMTLGSLFYMSPEQIRGDEVDGRSDLYSMGVLLYEMATGQRPFEGTSGYTVMAAHLEKAPPAPVDRNPELPGALSELILRALAKDKAARFQSAQEFREAVEALDRTIHGRVDGLILTRAFAVKAAELPSEALTLDPQRNSVTQTMPNTPTPGSGRKVALPPREDSGTSPIPAFAAIRSEETEKPRLLQLTPLLFGLLLVTFILVGGVFGPGFIREWSAGAEQESSKQAPGSATGDSAAAADSTVSQTASQPAAVPTDAGNGGGAATRPSPSPGAPMPPHPPAVEDRGDAHAGRPELEGEHFGPKGGMNVLPPASERPPREFDPEMLKAVEHAETELKAAGIDMKLFGPDAREGRRFAAVERAKQFSDLAKRFGAVGKRREAMDGKRRELLRAPGGDPNRRLRGKIANEMGEHWRKLTESSAAADAAIRSQNLTLAAEKITIAEKELDLLDAIIARATSRLPHDQN